MINYDSLRNPKNELDFTKTKGAGTFLNYIVKRFIEQEEEGIAYLNKSAIKRLEKYVASILKNIEAFNRFDIQPLVEQNNQEMLTRIMVLKDSNRINVSEIGYGAQYNMLIVLSILERIINHVKKVKDDKQLQTLLILDVGVMDKDKKIERHLPDIENLFFTTQLCFDSEIVYRLINKGRTDILEDILTEYDNMGLERTMQAKALNKAIEKFKIKKIIASKDYKFSDLAPDDKMYPVIYITWFSVNKGILLGKVIGQKMDKKSIPPCYAKAIRKIKERIPCIVRNLTDDEATIVMVDSNLQREKVLPSEKAFAYKMKLEAMNRQGKRTDLTSTPVVSKFRTNEMLGRESGESRETIRRYIRLTELIRPILDMVDEGKIAMRPAVELSYLPKDQQQVLFDTMEQEDCTPSHAQAIKMRKFAEAGKLNEDVILSIMTEEKPNQVEQLKIPKKRIDKYFSPGTTPKQIEDTIIKALELYCRRERGRER